MLAMLGALGLLGMFLLALSPALRARLGANLATKAALPPEQLADFAHLTYDPAAISIDEIADAVADEGYTAFVE